ncbi:MAG: hypothetical protein JXR03_18975 [Cyclobacteriaceae bacterium]
MKHLIAFFTVGFILLSCQKKDKASSDQIDSFSSPKALFVDHVSSFTGGVVSSTSDIRLKLTQPVSDSLIGTQLDGVFKFNPAIKGETSWLNNRTIIFQPSDKLPNDQKYEVEADLSKLIANIEKDKKTFRFIFQTLVQNYEVKVFGLKPYSTTDLTKLQASGEFQTADFVSFEKIKETLNAKQGDTELDIKWEDSGENNRYTFTVENIKKTKKEGKVFLTTSGAVIGVERDDNLEIEVPSLDNYKVVSSKVVEGKEKYISVMFSDPLDARQNLKGLVTLSGTNTKPRLVISLNELKIYPTEDVRSEMTLTINEAVKNSAGFELKEDYVSKVQFKQVKPEVRLISKEKSVILPSTHGLKLPFEAIGLKAVDVTVVRVFEDNVLQYLQVNRLGGTSQLKRVARPVTRKSIQLNTVGVTNLNDWNRYSIDLEEILTAEPGAMYQISIGFQKRHSMYFCDESNDIETIQEEDSWDASEEEESSYWDNYESYYNSNYTWQDRDNPCSDSYYGARRSVSKVLLATDLGLIAKRGDKSGLSVFVTNLIDTEPIADVFVEAYDYQQQLLGEGVTDGDGKATLDIKGKPFVLVAKNGNDVGYLKMDDGSSLSLSNFNIGGTEVQNGLKGFIYGERGVWRPADTVHLGFILEKSDGLLPEQHPVIMELFNPTGQLAFRKISSQPVGNMYRYDFVTDTEAPTGNWLAKAKVGGATFTKTVKIETIKPNRLKIDLKFDKEVFGVNDKSVNADLNVRWLSGATAGNLKAEYEVKLTPVKTKFEKFPNFSFDDPSKSFYSDRNMAYEGRIDASGYANITLDLGSTRNAPGALQANLYGKVYEEGGNFSISTTSIPYYPYSSFVGLKVPEGDKRGILLTDEDHNIQVVAVDTEGRPLTKKGVKVSLYKLNWRWWWDTSYDNISNYVGGSYRSPISNGKVDIVDGRGTYKLRVNYPQWGRYYLKVEDPNSGHSAGQVVYMDWPGWAGKGKKGELDGASMLDFASDKEEYKVGEDVILSIPSTEGNRILVSLESGSEIIQTFWVKAEKENTTISFKASPDMAPNIYAHLTMIQPHAQTENDLPIRLYGVQSIKIVDPSTLLKPVIKLPKELRPEQEFTVSISEENGKGMSYTLAIVDEGLLDITNYKTPKPWSTFFAREALGIKTWDIYDDVMNAYSGKMDYLLAIGGDGELLPKENKEANRFKPVVKYLGPFSLEPGAVQNHKITMPQYIGSVKTMVVASSDGAYGHTDVATPVKQPLMVLATLPRVAGPSEKMKLPVNLFALAEGLGEVDVTVKTEGTLQLTGKATQTISFAKSGDDVIYFDIQAKETLGVGKVKVLAKAGKLEANYDIEMNIISRNPMSTAIEDKLVDANSGWELEYEPLGILGKNGGSIEISSMPSLNIEQRLGYLIRYPHGCIEQTTSSVFPQVFLKNLVDLSSEKEASVQKNIAAGINRLKLFQLSSGGFSYWQGNNYPNNWGSNYAGHFLVEAKKAGYAVPSNMISNWVSFQTKRADSWGTSSSDDNNDLIQAYRLYTLAAAGEPALGAMNRMKEDKTIRTSAKWRLALAYALAGYEPQAQKIVEGLPTDVETSITDQHQTFGSNTRDKAMIMETMLALNMKEDAFEILMNLAKKMGDKDHWMSTQTTAYAFISISKYVETFNVESDTKVTITVSGQVENLSGDAFIYQTELKNGDANAVINIVNEGEAPIFARMIRTGIPMEGVEKPSKENIDFTVTYRDMDDKVIGVDRLKQGTNFKAEVTVANPGKKGDYAELALTQIFPSGWEILNTRLDGSEEANSVTEYLDIRDDRTMHYFDLKASKKATFTVLLNAAYQGKYYLPAIKAEAMYDRSIFANTAGKWVEVLPED